MKDTLSTCPSCSGPLLIRAYQCPECSTEIRGSFSGCPFCRMSDENRYFCLVFLQCEGNMKDVERIMGISYPTIKNRLSQIRTELDLSAPPERVRHEQSSGKDQAADKGSDDARKKRTAAIDALERGEIDFNKALELIKGPFRSSKDKA